MASGGWSFLKALENPSMDSKNYDENDEVYVHPMVKRSASALSTKSLEMCTESLGSETGSDVSESGDEFCAISNEVRERLRAIQRSKYRNFDRKIRRSDFPPPLTSISGSNCPVKVRHHREGGRLVIKAESFSNCGADFQVERTNGTLKLSLMKDCSVNYESERVEMEVYEEGSDVESDVDEKEAERTNGTVELSLMKDCLVNYESERVELENYEEASDVVSDVDEKEDEVEVAVAVTVAEEEEEEEGGSGGDGWREMDENRWRIAGKGELRRLTRCKEGGNGNKVFNWDPSWAGRVAIS